MLSAKKIGRRHIEYYLSYAARGAEGFWVGDGAASLGLTGTVEPEAFMALAEGTRPGGGRLLERVPADRAPGWDFTFSAPKSVSVCYALAGKELRGAIIEAHHRAASSAIRFLESEGGRARRGLAGRDGHVQAGLAVACFTHPSSRELDPQLHTHGIVLNVAFGEDGRWTAADSRTIYLHKRAGAAIYRAELRARLAALGATWGTPDRRGLQEMADIEPETLRAFSTRRAQIEERLAPGSSSKAAQVACLATRNQKVDVELEALTERWEAQAASLGWGTRRVQEVLDRTDRRVFLDDAARNRTEVKLLTPSGLTKEAAAFTRDDVIVAWAESVNQGQTREGLELLTDGTLRRDEVVPLVVADQDGHPLTTKHRNPAGSVLRLVRQATSANGTLVSEPRYSTRELLATEARLLESALGGRGASAGVADSPVIEQVLSARPHLSDEQAQMVRRACSSGDLVEVVVGVPGSGKTFALEAAKAIWVASGYRVLGAALSAAAAAQLQGGSGIASETFDSLRLRLQREREHLDRRSVLVIDEAGMLDTRRAALAVGWARRSGAKILLCGDDRQLPAVETGGAFAGLARRLEASRLTSNARQVAHWEREALRALREGRSGEAAGFYQRNGRVHTFESAGDLLGAMVTRWWTARSDGVRAVLYAYSRDAAWVLNTMARICLDQAGQLSGGELVVGEDSPLDLAERRYRAGDEICCLKNNRRIGAARDSSGLGVRNGTRGVVEEVDLSSDELSLRTEDGRVVHLPCEYVRRFTDYGYAWTLHKGQGQTVGQAASKPLYGAQRTEGRAFVYGADMLSAEAALVAASRATDSTELFVLVDPAEEHDEPRDIGSDLARAWARSEAETMATDELETQRCIAELAAAETREELGHRHSELTAAIGTGPLSDPVRLGNDARRALGAAAATLEEALVQETVTRERVSATSGEEKRIARAELRDHHRNLRSLEDDAVVAYEASETTDALLARQEAARNCTGSDLRLVARELELIDSALATERQRHIDALCDHPPDHVIGLLGMPPQNPRTRLRWRQGLVEIEDYRQLVGLGDSETSSHAPSPQAPSRASPWDRAIGEEPAGFEARRYRRVVGNIEAVIRDIGTEKIPLAQAVSSSQGSPDMVAAVLSHPRGNNQRARRRAPPTRGRGMQR